MSIDERTAESLKKEFETLASDGGRYLESLAGLKEQAEAYLKREDKHMSEAGFLTAEQEQESELLQGRVVQFGTRFFTALKLSPLLESADEENARNSLRGMRGGLGLQLHSLSGEEGHQYWSESDTTVERASEYYLWHVGELRKLLTMIAPSPAELPTAMVSRRNPEIQQYRPNTAFIMMQIDDTLGKLEDVKQGIKEVFKEFGILAQRADEIEHSDQITQRILDEIETCEVLFADLTGERPSVYYEVGYAHALKKRVIMYREKGTRLHFDLSVHNVKEYKNVTELKSLLRQRLEAVTGRSPKK